MEGLRAVSERLGEGRRANRHNHELLKVHAVVGVLATVEDVHHRNRQALGAGAAEIGIKRQSSVQSCGASDGH